MKVSTVPKIRLRLPDIKMTGMFIDRLWVAICIVPNGLLYLIVFDLYVLLVGLATYYSIVWNFTTLIFDQVDGINCFCYLNCKSSFVLPALKTSYQRQAARRHK